MHQYHFPLQTLQLVNEDFKLFYTLYSQCLANKFFSFSDLVFVHDLSQIHLCFADVKNQTRYRDTLQTAFDSPTRVVKYETGLFVPFKVGDSSVVAVVKDADRYLLGKADDEWLMEMRDSALAEFILIKQANVDPLTGLPNLAHLEHVLESCDEHDDLHLMLVEIFPRVRTACESFQYLRKVTLVLKNFFNDKFMIHSLGQGVFGIVTNNFKKETHSRMGTSLISWMRRENCRRVHIGCGNTKAGESVILPEIRRESILDRAWHALQISSKRGPFSYCDYDLLTKPEVHTLRRPSRKISSRLQRKWKNSLLFSVAKIQVDVPDGNTLLDQFFLELPEDFLVQDGGDYYIYLDKMGPEEASEWVDRAIRKFAKKKQSDVQISVGIGTYPFSNFTKTEIILNCRKALLHADFFGPGSKVIFDPVSLNISGDIYYGDGDYPSAIKEYKRGLLIDPYDINLLNSLGVANAVIEKSKEAHVCFERVLTKDPENFMALYNLGLGEELQGEEKSALKRFEKAIMYLPDDESAHLVEDLNFQLGKLYCRTGQYERGLEVLVPWYEACLKDVNSGRALSYIGCAYHGLKKHKYAMTWLQRALQFDEFDAHSMGLLGAVYFEAGEGGEVALSLCRKSVELEPLNKKLRLYLGRVQMGCGLYSEAKITLRKCVTYKPTRIEARFQLGCLYENEKRWRNARVWFRKVLEDSKVPRPIKRHIKRFEEVH